MVELAYRLSFIIVNIAAKTEHPPKTILSIQNYSCETSKYSNCISSTASIDHSDLMKEFKLLSEIIK